MKHVWAMTLVLAGNLALAGQVYKWTDDKGKVHYSDKPVASGALKVEQKIGNAPAEVDGSAVKRQQDCLAAKDKLSAYEMAAKVVERDALGREHEYTGSDKQKLLEQQRERITEACSKNSAPSASGSSAKQANAAPSAQPTLTSAPPAPYIPPPPTTDPNASIPPPLRPQ